MRKIFIVALIVMAAFFVSSLALAGRSTTKTVSAEDTYTNPIALHGYYTFSLKGTWAGTVYIQRCTSNCTVSSNWGDVEYFTGNIEAYGVEPKNGALYRAGFKTGGYTSGDAVITLEQGDKFQ